MRQVLFWCLVLIAGGPAIILTLARFPDTTMGIVVRLQAFVPFAIPLFVIEAVLLVVGALLLPSGRPVQLALALVTLVGLGLNLWWWAPQVLGEVPAAAPGARVITVMNSNVFEGLGDPGQVVAAVQREGVDLLVVEEITPAFLEGMDASGLADLLPYRAGRALPGVSGTMVFSDQKLGETTRMDTRFESFLVQVGDLTLAAVHPIAPVSVTEWHREQRVVLDAAVDGDADLIVGDFNTTPDHPALRAYFQAGYRDAAELANQGWQPTWPANHLGVLPLLPPVVRIDHVLVTSKLTALSTRTVPIDGTDHLSLIAEVALRG